MAIPTRLYGAKGPYSIAISRGNLSNCGRRLLVSLYPTWGNLRQSKIYKLELTFVKTCSDLLASHQRKCDCAWPTTWSSLVA
jgi:hypothetical protein